jgi:hypothetical protein
MADPSRQCGGDLVKVTKGYPTRPLRAVLAAATGRNQSVTLQRYRRIRERGDGYACRWRVLRKAAAGDLGSLMRLLEHLPRFDSRRKLRLELEKVGLRAAVLAAERDQARAERDAYLRQRDEALGERDAYLSQRDGALGERDAYLRQRDNAIGEYNEILRQRDEQIGLKNLLTERSALYVHRADVVTRPAAATSDHLLLFLHLAKTGGMTLANTFARNFAAEEFLQIDMAETNASALGIWSHRAIEQALTRLQPSEAAKLRVVWGHYCHGVQFRLPKPCAVVTLLRDPVDRIISAYYYSNGSVGGGLAKLEEYLARKHYHIGFDNPMSRIISGRADLDPIAAELDATTENFAVVTEPDFEVAANNLDGYLVVGTTEQFDETLLVLGRDLRWSLSDLYYAPVNVTASRPAQLDISDALREKILDWNRYDSLLVERARAHLARRIAGYPGDFSRDLSLFRELNSQFQRGAPIEALRRIERDAVIGDASSENYSRFSP